MSIGLDDERNKTPRIMTFRPSYEEFKDFSAYIKFMESRGAHLAGLAKVIPPPEWKPRQSGYDIDQINMTIPAPICQVVSGKQGEYQQINVMKRSMTLLFISVIYVYYMKVDETMCSSVKTNASSKENLTEIDDTNLPNVKLD